MESQIKLVPVVISGGIGSRLWPVSRETHPKPFIGTFNGRNLLQHTFLRANTLPFVEEVMIVTGKSFFFQTQDSCADLCAEGYSPPVLLVEPCGRNTAPAITSAALWVSDRHGEDAVMLVMPVDHIIGNVSSFSDAVSKAIVLASENGSLVTFGIKPHSAKLGYGYIEAEGERVVRFIEKPNMIDAEKYAASERFFWNFGIFCFTAKSILQEMGKYAPSVVEGVTASFQKSRHMTASSARKECRTNSGNAFEYLVLDSDEFCNVSDISIDYAVMEHSENISIIPCDIDWQDVGTWPDLAKFMLQDNNKNRTEGNVILEDVDDCIIHADSRLVAGLGLKDLMIIDTADALLVASKSRAQDVKSIYKRVKESGHSACKIHAEVYRPWGKYTVLEEASGFKIKRIEVKPGAALSFQMHCHRSEHWVVVSGTAKVTNSGREYFLGSNESTYVPVGSRHRLENFGSDTLIIIEVQCGNYLEEDDIFRFEDSYGRKGSGDGFF